MLPSLCLYYSISLPTYSSPALRHESFGSGDYYLDLQLEGIPGRAIRGKNSPESMEIKGVLASTVDEQPILGKRIRVSGQTWYLFATTKGKFLGWLTPATKGCELNLQFRIEKNSQVVETGTMKAGFCD